MEIGREERVGGRWLLRSVCAGGVRWLRRARDRMRSLLGGRFLSYWRLGVGEGGVIVRIVRGMN